MRVEDNNKEKIYLYRYVDGVVTSKPMLRKYLILKETPKGYWIQRHPHDTLNKRFVYKSGRNNYAKSTTEEALESYIARKLKQVDILTINLGRAKSMLQLAQNIKNGVEQEQEQSEELSW